VGILLDGNEPESLARIMGSLMHALVEAQAESARTTVDFIRDVAFGPDAPETATNLVNVRFRYEKLDENQLPAPFTLEVPLLAMVDIPVISVKTATFQFAYDVTTVEKAEGEATAPAVGDSLLAKPSVIKGRFVRTSLQNIISAKPQIVAGTTPTVSPSSAQESSREKGSVHVVVEIEKAPPPVGVERILDMLEVASKSKKVEP
jgi:hypothetical protein